MSDELENNMTELTHDQKAIHFETWQHIYEVQKLLHKMQVELGRRALEHDQSKMQHPEAETFAEYTPRLKHIEYGSDEYRQCMKEMGPAIKHHQENNRHHPEMHEGGVNGMNLVDLLEMLCDWKAATMRTKNGDIRRSLEIQRKRFGLSDQLMSILENTIPLIEGS
jgi:hypothetical protein